MHAPQELYKKNALKNNQKSKKSKNKAKAILKNPKIPKHGFSK